MIVHTIGVPAEQTVERTMWKSDVIAPKDYEPKKLSLEDPEQDGGFSIAAC